MSVAVFVPPTFSTTFPKTVARGRPRGFFLQRDTRVPTRLSQWECISTCVTLVTLWWDFLLERRRWGVVGAHEAQVLEQRCVCRTRRFSSLHEACGDPAGGG